ncbi:MAG: rhodanese-like domain-containing protein [Burkholderiaceae bacterium]|nr:rhodanese-like domain-containing protein [Burkholderiaceae bacterium]
MKRYLDIVADALTRVKEIMPWDLRDRLANEPVPLLLDVREPQEFALAHIAGSLNVPRGVLEQACEWDYDTTVPALARTRRSDVVVVCRSGQRSILAADVMQTMGYTNVLSLKTGVRGWNDFELPLFDAAGQRADTDTAEAWLSPPVRPDQRRPAR